MGPLVLGGAGVGEVKLDGPVGQRGGAGEAALGEDRRTLEGVELARGGAGTSPAVSVRAAVAVVGVKGGGGRGAVAGRPAARRLITSDVRFWI